MCRARNEKCTVHPFPSILPWQTFVVSYLISLPNFRLRQGPEDPHADREAGVAPNLQEQHVSIRYPVSEWK